MMVYQPAQDPDVARDNLPLSLLSTRKVRSREMNRWKIHIAVVQSAAALLPLAAYAVPAQTPNIVFVMADDLGWRDLSCFGSTDEAARFIRENHDRPFFLNYWQFSVHAPYDAKGELVAKYRRLADPENPQRNPVYAAMIESLEDGVGRVLDALKQCQLMDRTIIVYFSDNGGVSWPGKDDKGHKSERFASDMTFPPTSNLPLRNGKASCYEGGVRVPCIVVWPGVTEPGTTNDTVIQSIDWMPTLLEMAGVPLPGDAEPDGISIVPALKGGTLDRDAIFCHFPHDTPASGQHPATTVRRGDWKLIRAFAGNDDGSDKLELYNLAEDLGEVHDVAAERPTLVRELNELIGGFLKETDAVMPKLNPDYNPAAAKKARAPRPAGPLQGWVPRGCRAAAKDGILTVTGIGSTPFLGVGAGARGPGTVEFRVRSASGGPGKLEWIPPGETQAAARSNPFVIKPAGWQTIEVALPPDATLGIMRVYLPAQNQSVEVDWIRFKTATKTKRWDF